MDSRSCDRGFKAKGTKTIPGFEEGFNPGFPFQVKSDITIAVKDLDGRKGNRTVAGEAEGSILFLITSCKIRY